MSGSILKAVSLGSQHTQEKFSLVKQPAGREPQFFYSTELHWEIWYKKILTLHSRTDPPKGTPISCTANPNH